MCRSAVRVLLLLAVVVALGAAVTGSTPTTALARTHDSDAVPERTVQDEMIPGDPVPPITLPTTAGDVSFGGGPDDESYVLLGRSALSAYSEALWASSVPRLIEFSPDDVNYVFMSYADTPEGVMADIDPMQEKVSGAIAALDTEAERQHWTDHFHFVTVNPLTLDEPVPSFLKAWGAVLAAVDAEWVDDMGQPQAISVMGTTDSGWAKSLTETGPITRPLAWYGGLACADELPTQDPTDRISLIERGTCPFTEKAGNAETHGAVAALLFTDDRDKGTMGGTCDPCPDIPIAMIDRQPGLDLVAQLEATNPVTATMAPAKIGVEAMAVNQGGLAREFGSIPFPFNDSLPAPIDNFEMIGYEAQHMHYEHVRDSRLAGEEAAGEVTVVPVFEEEWADDPGWAGKRSYAEVALPDAATMATFDTMELDLSMACPDNKKGNCPAWDYIVHMYLCEQDDPDVCPIEVGRWITPYWSGGSWVTDVSPMLGYLSGGGTRRFAFYTQQRYKLDLDIRLSNHGKGATGKRAFDLGLNGGQFWNAYNSRFYPIEFTMPDWAEKVEVMAYITGHGFGKDAENCAEFCNHTHHFAVNGGEEHDKTHPEAQALMGCADQVKDGTVPNQGGTWIYGRGGWCPGLDVKPWVIDITDEVVKGELNELTYRGLFDGEDYVPVKGPGQDPNEGFDARITMRAFLVYSAAEGVAPGPVDPPRWRVPGTIYMPTTLNAFGE